MTTHKITDARLSMLKDGDWVDVDLSNTILGFCEDNYLDTVIIDEEWNHERLKEHMVDRYLDHLFVFGTGTCSALPTGYTPAKPYYSLSSYFDKAFDRNERGRQQHLIRKLQGPVTANGNYGHLVKDVPALPSITKALLSRIK